MALSLQRKTRVSGHKREPGAPANVGEGGELERRDVVLALVHRWIAKRHRARVDRGERRRWAWRQRRSGRLGRRRRPRGGADAGWPVARWAGDTAGALLWRVGLGVAVDPPSL